MPRAVSATLLTFLLLTVHTAGAQSVSPRDGGDADLFFGIDGIDLESLAGEMGGRYWLSRQWALLAAGTARGDVREDEGFRSQRDHRFGLHAGLERHLATYSDRLTPYASLTIGFGRDRRRDESEQPDDRFRPVSERSHLFVTSRLGLGAEYRLNETFALAGQYRLFATYGTGSRQDTDLTGTTEHDSWYVQYGLRGVLLRLAVRVF